MLRKVRSKHTRPELAVRRIFDDLGLRYTLHARDLPGTPDIVMRRFKLAIFVHGCFWHQHAGCRFATTPATRPEFWKAKFENNAARDKRDRTRMGELGWRVATVWECALVDRTLDATIAELIEWIRCGYGNRDFGEPAAA